MTESRHDELLKKLNELRNCDSGNSSSRKIVDVLNDLCGSCFEVDTEKARDYAIKARELAQRCDYSKGLGRSYQVEGFTHWTRGEFREAENCYRKALDHYRDVEYTKGIGNVYNNLGAVLDVQGRYEYAIDNYKNSLEIYEDIGYESGQASTCANLGIIFARKNKTETALDYQKRALEIFQKAGNKKYEANVLDHIGSIMSQRQCLEDAIDYYSRSLELRRELDDKKGIAFSFRFLGQVYRKLNRYEQALDFCQKSKEIVEEIGHRRGVLLAGKMIGRIYLELEEFDLADEHLRDGLELARETGVRVEEYAFYRFLSSLHEKKGNYSRALDYYKKFTELKEDVDTDKFNDKIAVLQTDHEFKEKKKEAEIEHLKNVALRKEIDERKKAEKNLRQLSIEDPLTGIFNRRYFFRVGRKTVERTYHKDGELALAILDLDHFKRVNDMLGHQTGDAVLQSFVKIVEDCVRPKDVFARYGGEEFVLLMNHTSNEEARKIIERVRRNTESAGISIGNQNVDLTISAGISYLSEVSSDVDHLEELLKVADKRMYKAKTNGRNNVI